MQLRTFILNRKPIPEAAISDVNKLLHYTTLPNLTRWRLDEFRYTSKISCRHIVSCRWHHRHKGKQDACYAWSSSFNPSIPAQLGYTSSTMALDSYSYIAHFLIPHAFAKQTWKKSNPHHTFPLKSTTTRTKLQNCFQMATKSQQQFPQKLTQLAKSRVDIDYETLNRRDRLTISAEKLWPQKLPKNTLALPTQNKSGKELASYEDWLEVGIAQTLRGEGMVANCVAARSR